jgi:hypothetical protein
MIKVLIISAAVVAAVPCYAQEVRVFNGPFEHVYGPGGRLLDSPELRAKNEQVRRQLLEEQWGSAADQRDAADPYGQEAPLSWWAEVPHQPPLSAWSDQN